MADDNIYDSDEDDDYKPEPEKRDGRKEQRLQLARAGRGKAKVEAIPVADPVAQAGTDAKKAKINAIWEQLNAKKDAVRTSTVGRGGVLAAGAVPKTGHATSGWMKNLGMAPKRPAFESKPSPAGGDVKGDERIGGGEGVQLDLEGEQNAEAIRKEEARKIASAALAAAKAAAKTITDGKLEINEVRDFAGEEVRVTKYVDVNSKAAVAARRKAEMQVAASAGLDALLEQIGKKPKLNILDKSRKDWGEFKEEKGIENELEMHNKSGDTYTEKIAFLQRADLREYEKERDARLAGPSKRRSEAALID